MKFATLFIAFLGLLTVSSCGPSAEEVRQQQEAIIKKKYADKAALENSLKDFQGNLKNLKNSLVQTKADLSVGIDEMSRIKEWQLGRSSGEREEQIRSQSIYIQKLESKIQNIEEEISSHSSKIAELKVTLKTFE